MDKLVETVSQIPVHQIPIKDLFLATEAPKGSDLAVRDSSQGGPLSDAEIKASLAYVGLINPLLFKAVDAKFYVVAGNRRLRFLREIHADNPDALVKCQNVADYPVDWRELALDTNLTLPPHPVERYEQMVAIAKDRNMSPEDVRERFGLSARQYSQIMALGNMAPQIRDRWKAGEIDFKTAQVFTLEPNHKEQVRLCEQIEKQNGGKVYEHVLRMKIVPPNQAEAGRMVTFLGVEFCKQAGLIKQEDFFASSHIVTDTKELQRLFDERLWAICISLTDKKWSWALPEHKIPPADRWNYHSLEPKGQKPSKAEEAKIKSLEAELQNYGEEETERSYEDIEDELARLQEEIKQRAFTDEQKSKTGCILKINHKGELQIEYGRMKPSDRKKVEASERAASAPKKGGKDAGDQPVMSAALAQRLSEGLQTAIAAAMKEAPHVAVAALIAGAGSGGALLDIHVKDAPPKWKEGEKDFLQLFEGARSASQAQQVVMLTQIAMQALSIVTFSPVNVPLEGKPLQALVANLPAAAVNRYIAETFNPEDYFKGVNLGTVVAAVRCAIGDDLADKVAKMKKADAVKVAVEQLPKKGWLPPELRTVHYKGPTEKAAPRKDKATPAKKAKPAKAAPAKKAAKKKGKK